MDTNKDKKDQIFIAFVIVGVLGVIVSNLFSSSVNFEILATQSAIFAITMYGIFYGIPSIFINFRKWINTPKIKNIKLEKKYMQNGTLAFQLLNKEYRKPAIWVSRLQIADNPLSWFPISSAGFSIKSGSSKEIFHLKWDKPHRYFVVADFQNDDYKKVFGVGIYKFDIVVTYGFSEKGNDKIKRFAAIVSLEENGVIRVVEMKHSD
jgi:hypothetical protein